MNALPKTSSSFGVRFLGVVDVCIVSFDGSIAFSFGSEASSACMLYGLNCRVPRKHCAEQADAVLRSVVPDLVSIEGAIAAIGNTKRTTRKGEVTKVKNYLDAVGDDSI